MTVVIDVGCAPHGNEQSIGPLLARFSPAVLYGFDPLLGGDLDQLTGGGAPIVLRKRAAWIYTGEVEMTVGENPWEAASSTLMPEARGFKGRKERVKCIDLAQFIEMLGREPVVLKLDVEGAEYPLLEHLAAHEARRKLERVLVEWHPIPGGLLRQAQLVGNLPCPVEPW